MLLVSVGHAERLAVKTYTVADGLLRDAVDKIRQDSRGFLWFCTAEGISRFDGEGMTNFTVADGLPHRSVTDFLETKTGTIYIATERGLAMLNPDGSRDAENSFFKVFLPENPRAEKIQTLLEGRNGQVWAGTSDGLYKLSEAVGQLRFDAVVLGEALKLGDIRTETLTITSIADDRHGNLWVGTYGSGLFRISAAGRIGRFTKADGFSDDKITSILEDKKGRLWLTMRSDATGGVCRVDTEKEDRPVEKCFSTKDGLGSNWIRGIHESSDGQIWLATVPGLCKWQEDAPAGQSVCRNYTAKNDLCGDILSILEDKDGNLWTGTSCGVKKIARYGFTTYDTADGLASSNINSIFENSSGELFVAGFPKTDRSVSRLDGDKFTSVKLNLPPYVDYHGWGWGQTVLEDRKKAWWVSTGLGLFRTSDDSAFDSLDRIAFGKQETGAREKEVFRLFEDSRGDIWIATTEETNELFRWERAKNTWHDHTSQAGFGRTRIGTAFAEDRDGNVWIGVSSEVRDTALVRYRKGEFRVLSERDGAPSGWIRDLMTDSRGRLWIASTNDGLWRIDQPNGEQFEFVKYTTTNGLTSNAVASITEDEYGRIYLGTWRGLDRLNPETDQVENFTAADGLPASFIEISFRDRNNNLWFGTGDGLARLVPEPPRTRIRPTILITGLRIEAEPQRVSVLGVTEIPSLILNSHQQQISIDYVGLGATLGERLKYEYRLDQGDWTQTPKRTINFANFSAGEYRLEIRTQTADRLYSEPAVVSFSIAAPIWQRWWFAVVVVGLSTIIFYGFYRFRMRRLLEVANMRTRIATDLHDDIGANLTKIAILSEVAQQRLVQTSDGINQNGFGKLLGSVAEISRESVSSMSDIVWAINPQKDSFIGLSRRMRSFAEEVLERSDIRLEFSGPTGDDDLKLNADIRRNVYLIFKETISNVVKHSNARAVRIDCGLADDEIRLRIEDDGDGFDPAVTYEGNGLLNIAKRAKDCGGRLEVISTPQKGTTVSLTLAIKSAWNLFSGDRKR